MMHRIFSVLISILAIHAAEACTAFQLKAEDGTQIYCRTLEFGFKLDSNILIVPQGIEYTGTAPGAQSGLKWKTKYGFVGLNQPMAPTLVSDGMNKCRRHRLVQTDESILRLPLQSRL